MYLLDRQYLVRLELPLRLLNLWNLMDQSHQYFRLLPWTRYCRLVLFVLVLPYFRLFPWDLFHRRIQSHQWNRWDP